MITRLSIVVLLANLLVTGAAAVAAEADDLAVRSPDGKVVVFLEVKGAPSYRVTYRDKVVVEDSTIGLTFKGSGPLADLKVTGVTRQAHDETYPVLAGKSSTARDHHNQATITLEEQGGQARRVELILRAYDDGVAFRYSLPDQPSLKSFSLTSEDTTFTLPSNATAWLLPIPRNGGHYEYLYQTKRVADFPANELIGLPLLIELPDNGPAVAITEANLTNYAGMAVKSDGKTLRASLTPLPTNPDVKVKGATPFLTPWRVIQVAESAGKLIESNIVLNLSDPCKLPDTSWIKPGKILFLWWNDWLVGANGRRGHVDTATVNHYVDGAAEFGFPYSSIDGLDIAWYGGKIPGYGENDITVPVKELDIQKVLARAKEKNVRIRLWVASAGMRKYLDKALETYAKWGVEGVMVDFIERDDQESINWIHELVEKAAKHKLTVTLHNVPKPTGLSRTYPNLLNYEAVRNQEWNKWDPVGVPPEHNLIVPFTRMLAGPLDYHSGGFRHVRTADFRPRDVAPDVMGTRCHQLAMYVVQENPMPMAVDYPAAYRKQAGIEFLSAVPTTWDETRFIQGKVGDHITLARRKGDTWYVGTMTDDTPRELSIPLTFLPPGTYTAETWADDIPNGPVAVTRDSKSVTAADTLTIKLAPAGGHVARIGPSKK